MRYGARPGRAGQIARSLTNLSTRAEKATRDGSTAHQPLGLACRCGGRLAPMLDGLWALVPSPHDAKKKGVCSPCFLPILTTTVRGRCGETVWGWIPPIVSTPQCRDGCGNEAFCLQGVSSCCNPRTFYRFCHAARHLKEQMLCTSDCSCSNEFVFNPSPAGKPAARRNATLCYLGALSDWKKVTLRAENRCNSGKICQSAALGSHCGC